jgi:hypothetical protein
MTSYNCCFRHLTEPGLGTCSLTPLMPKRIRVKNVRVHQLQKPLIPVMWWLEVSDDVICPSWWARLAQAAHPSLEDGLLVVRDLFQQLVETNSTSVEHESEPLYYYSSPSSIFTSQSGYAQVTFGQQFSGSCLKEPVRRARRHQYITLLQ